MPIFNSIDFLETPVNGDVILEAEITQPARPKSDFYITPPRIKVDEYIKKAIDEVNNAIINTKIDDLETSTSVSVLAGDVKILMDDKERLTADVEALNADLDGKREELTRANASGDASRAADISNEVQMVEAALKKANELLSACEGKLAAAEATFNDIMAGTSTSVYHISKVVAQRKPISFIRSAIKNADYDIRKELLAAGITGEVGKTSAKLRRSSVDNNIRLLLSNEPIYVFCLYRAYKDDGVKDAHGLLNRVMVYIDEVQTEVQGIAAEQFFKSQKLDASEIDKTVFIEQVKSARFSYATGKPVAFMKNLINQQMKFGNLPKYVDDFFANNEIPTEKGTPEIRKKMVDYLHTLDLHITGSSLPAEKFDEYFANAYAHAAKLGTSEGDPVKNIFSDVQVDFFDFKVDYFETVEEQAIDRQNLLAAAVLFYNKVLADDLGILRITDAIIMAWTQGKLDIPQGETATKLYRYYKLRKERTTAEERAMFYKIVFNSGNAEVLEDAVVNTEFSQLWSTLMNETVKYIQKFEANENANEYVSKVGIYNSIKNLQYNLSVFMSGMVKSLLPEMYAQLQSAIDILKRPEIVSQLGQGYHRNMWKVIERVSSEAFNYIPNVSALRTIAVKGHSVFHAIAQFDEAQFTEEQFRTFITDVEEFIVANGQVEIRDSDDTEEEDDVPEEKDDWNF
jgi:uncharacterized protein YoxC